MAKFKVMGTMTGRWSGAMHVHTMTKEQCRQRWFGTWHGSKIAERLRVKAARLDRKKLLAFETNQKLSPKHGIERYVRKKNTVYRKWRKGKQFRTLDDWCTECMFRFGQLPAWEKYVQARRTRNWSEAERIELQHREWKNEVRQWCLDRGITTFANQSAQFLKYYFAWYRWQHEQKHGVITRPYGRQMQ